MRLDNTKGDLLKDVKDVQCQETSISTKSRTICQNSNKETEGGRLKSKTSCKGTWASSTSQSRRLEFARVHANWNEDHWGKILFTDETRIQLWKPDGHSRVYRRSGNVLQIVI
ncbi:hypothetical protein JTB14_013513 [Gonioctena quinquepunctata]|nr:hypothetical protein JTB14_013513 [Gonioctena quinquepunctata]